VDGAEYNTNSEMIIWLWSSTMAMKNWCAKFPFAVVPMRYLPSKELRSKANKRIVEAIAWDSSLVDTKDLWYQSVKDCFHKIPELVRKM